MLYYSIHDNIIYSRNVCKSLSPAKCACDFECLNFKHNLMIDISSKHYPGMNAKGSCWWLPVVNIGSGNGLLPDSTNSLPEPMLTQIYWAAIAINWTNVDQDLLDHNELMMFYFK